MPRILFAVTVTMVLIDGYFRTDFVNSLAFIGDPFQMSILYAFSLIGILGVHESGHLIAAKNIKSEQHGHILFQEYQYLEYLHLEH